jgi:hypothetical protein
MEMKKMKYLVIVMAALICALTTIDAVHVFDTYRAVQYDNDGEPYGSRKVRVDYLAIAVPNKSAKKTAAAATNGDNTPVKKKKKAKRLSRNVVVLTMEEATKDTLQDLIFTRKCGALLILIPSSFKNIPSKTLTAWKNVEKWLINMEVGPPLYFSIMDEKLESTYNALVQARDGSKLQAYDDYRLVSDLTVPKKIDKVKLMNIQGWIAGTSNEPDVDSESLGTVAIVAHYDSFGAAPGLSHGVDSNGSGVAALLELSRLFATLYQSSDSRAPYNVLFVLTAAGHINYAGSKEWLSNTDAQLLDSIEFALCIDSIGHGENLYLHLSKPRKSPAIKKFLNSFQVTSKNMGIDFKSVHKKINLTNPVLSWEHEQFSLKQIVSGTLSHYKKSRSILSRSSIFDVKETSIDMDILKRNIQFIAESLAVYMYAPVRKIQSNDELSGPLFDGTLGVDMNYVDSWLDTFERTARVGAVVDDAASKKSKGKSNSDSNSYMLEGTLGTTNIRKGLQKSLKAYVDDTSKQEFVLEKTAVTPYEFYAPVNGKMSAYLVKPVTFDLMMTLVTVIYLIALHVYFKGFKSLMDIFSSK